MQYQAQLESQDSQVKMCLTRHKKNVEFERMPKFPITCAIIKAKHMHLIEKQHLKEKQ